MYEYYLSKINYQKNILKNLIFGYDNVFKLCA